jgi:hypothetical protein
MTTTETFEPFDCLLSPENAALAIGFDPKNARILFACGLVGVQVGDSTFVRESDLRAWVKNLRKAVVREVEGYRGVAQAVREAAE